MRERAEATAAAGACFGTRGQFTAAEEKMEEEKESVEEVEEDEKMMAAIGRTELPVPARRSRLKSRAV